MSLEAGHKLAHYEILEPVGKGGMGEVYRAKDSKLGRDVAIKVLPDEFARDDERLKRFQREAKVLAALNHPNIASIYGLEQAGETHYLVLELVPGETLAERIARGPIARDEGIAIASKIADALGEAHEQGIVHRDLKPANVKLTPDDKVKVLDFGLAKALCEDTAEADTSMSPTITRDATRAGVILGTAAYMSPEQARGKLVDKRADIFAFGVVLYEMLTRKKAFPGDDVSEVLASVIKLEPNWAALDGAPHLQALTRRCLAKDPKARWRDIGDVRFALTEPESPSTGAVAEAPSRPWWLVAVAASLVSALAVWGWMGRPSPPPAVAQFVINASPSPNLLYDRMTEVLAISPDGSNLVYRSGREDASSLVVRRLDQLEGRRVDASVGGSAPFFSPDGAWIGYQVGLELTKASVAGGTPMTIARLAGPVQGASWGTDGTIIFGDGATRSLLTVSDAGGEAEVLLDPRTMPDVESDAAFWWPSLLPGGRALLFTIQAWTSATRQVAVLDMETSEVKILLSPGTHARYVPTGHIVYGGGDGTLRAIGFDVDRLEVLGASTVLIDGILTLGTGATAYDIAANGSLAYAIGDACLATNLVWVDRFGREEPIETQAMSFDHPRVSPDGRRIAVRVDEAGSADIYVMDLERGTIAVLTRAAGYDTSPVWSPDGSAIVFGSSRDNGGLFRIAPDGTGAVERVAASVAGGPSYPHSWSQNDEIVFYQASGPTRGDIYRVFLDSSEVEPVLAVPELRESHPELSPDGRFIAYTGNESGRSEIYVRPFPNVDDGRYLISGAGGEEPLWSPDGTELFYWDVEASTMMAVPVTLEPTFQAGVATSLFSGNYAFPQAGRHYDISPDGQRFLMVKTIADSDTKIVLVQNWTQELTRLVPAER